MIGFDFGIKPNLMVVGDIEYQNLIHESKPLAMGYGKLPYFNLLIDPPFACIIFENEEKGKECFQHFKRWADKSEDGDAVALSFIESNDGGYTVCIYPETDMLIDRCIPKYLQTEITPFVKAPTSFPLTVDQISDNYLSFKQQTQGNYFLLCGGSKTEGPFLDVAIQKRNVQFYKEDEIPDNSPEISYFAIKTKESQQNFERKPLLDSSEEISKRRWKRLKTFLPITIERLKYQPNFQSSKDSLISEGFTHWQILQAACNIVVSYRICEKLHYKELNQKSAQIDILDYLLNNFEEADTPKALDNHFSIEILRKQIIADTTVLLNHIGSKIKDKSKQKLIGELRKRGFLGKNA